MKKSSMSRGLLGTTALAVAIVWSGSAWAQTAASPPPGDTSTENTDTGVEEIVVTAQKREQSLQDVPIAVTAITEASIQANRITSVQDLSGLAPNLIVRPSAGGSAIPAFSMRGEQSQGVVPGSDKQVSINLDGVYISATRGALFELPDIARIEVLRGPQGTLFGRNATAGAVSIVTKDPDGQLGARLELGIGNYDQRRIRASIDLPQWGPFSAYVSFVHNEREGDIRNLGAGTRWDRTGIGTFNGQTYNTNQGVQYSPERLGDKNVETYFAALKFEPSDRFKAIYKYDLSVDHSTPEGVGVTGLNFDPVTAGAGGVILGAIVNNQPASGPFGPVSLSPARRPDAVNNFFTTPSFLKNQGHNLTATFDATDHLSFKNIAAYRKSYLQEAVSQIGGLGGLVVTPAGLNALYTALLPASLRAIPAAQNGLISSLTNGLVTNANNLVGYRFVDVGTNIQNVSKQWSDELQGNYNSKFLTVTFGAIYFHSKDQSGPAQYTRSTPSLAFFPSTGEVPLGIRTAVSYNTATSIAGYAQAEFHVTPTVDLVAGGRLTHDRKNGVFVSGINPATGASSGTFVSSVPGCPATSNPVGDCRLAGTYTLFSIPFPEVYKNTRFTYSLGVNYKPTNALLAYAKYSTGYVSGGSIGGLAFAVEKAKSAEAGLKADFLDRHLRTNLALFYARYTNAQLAASGRNTFDPKYNRFRDDLGTAVINGFNEKTYGLEFEATAVPVDGLTLTGSLGYTHIDVSFSAAQRAALLTALVLPGLQTLDTLRYQQYTGVPKFTSNLSAQYVTRPLFADATVLARIDANWRSRLYNDLNRDRATLIPALGSIASSPPQWILNGRVALQNVKFGTVSTELAVWARNITNNRYSQYPLILNFEASTSYQAARTFGLDLIVKY